MLAFEAGRENLSGARQSLLSGLAVIVVVVAGVFIGPRCGHAQGLPTAEPNTVDMDPIHLARIKDVVDEGLRNKNFPGCVICVGRRGRIVFHEAYGNRQVEPEQVPMTTDTVFDLASLTKPIATATSVMKLIEQGKLRLNDRVSAFFPEFAANGKRSITVRHLLIHQSGLIPDNALKDYLDGPEEAWKRICELDLVAPIGTTFKYSDVNFIVLAKLVEEISGQDIHRFSRQEVFGPLGMTATTFRPGPELRRRAAPTERRNGSWMQGEVHDPRAYELGGVAGHAGLFSTAADLAVYAQMMLDRGTLSLSDKQVRILSPATVGLMTKDHPVSSGIRGLGWDKQTGFSSNRGDLLSDRAFGHGGFTGTVIWMDPENDVFFIFLSNRVHPNGQGSVNYLAGRMVNVVASSILAP